MVQESTTTPSDTDAIVGESRLIRTFNNLTGRGVLLFLAACLALSLITTGLVQTFGTEAMKASINWDVYVFFVAKVFQRGFLVAIMMTVFSIVILGIQGLTSLKALRDSDKEWVANSLGFAILAAILFVGAIA